MSEAQEKRDRFGIPPWLMTILLSAAFAVIGFFGREVYGSLVSGRAAHEQAIIRLEQFQNLLDQSTNSFLNQNYMARRLLGLLERSHPDSVGEGFDQSFFNFHDRMNSEELELFTLIRGTTKNSMHNLNQQLLAWAAQHTDEGLDRMPEELSARFAAQLDTLRIHLNLWFDKYESLFEPDPRRSLVYLADEKRHGVAFPSGIRVTVAEVLEEQLKP